MRRTRALFGTVLYSALYRHSFIWPILVSSAKAGYGFQGLESLTGYTISLLSVLNRVSFWNESLAKSAKTCDERSTFAIPTILYTKQNKSGSESNVSCLKPLLNRVAE